MSSPRPARPLALGETFAKLTEMLDDVGGPVDRERRRAAARLSDLVRTDDDEGLSRFTERHLPGRDVDAEALKDAREVAVELARMIAMLGEAPEAATTLHRLRELSASLSRSDEARGGEAPGLAATPPERASAASPSVVAAPPAIPAPPAASALPTFMQPPLASASSAAWPSAVEPAARITPAPVTPPVPASAPRLQHDIPQHDVPQRKAAPDPGTTQRLRALPPGTPVPPVLPFSAPASAPHGPGAAPKPEATTTALPFTPPPPPRRR